MTDQYTRTKCYLDDFQSEPFELLITFKAELTFLSDQRALSLLLAETAVNKIYIYMLTEI